MATAAPTAGKRPRDPEDAEAAAEAAGAAGDLDLEKRRRTEDAMAAAVAMAPAAAERPWTYVGQKICAPMVRISMLPFRLAAAEYGADIVYSEELMARKLETCSRVVNEAAGTVDFYRAAADNRSATYPVLRVVPGERLALQIGAADAVHALRAASVVAGDVRAVGINAGCPKGFSVKTGCGSALLKKPEVLHDILSTLKRNLTTPVTVKIRLLADTRQSVQLAQVVERSGVDAITVHGRRKDDRPRHRPLYDDVRAVKDAVNCPVVANGDCFQHADFLRVRAETGCDSVMAARGAMWNASIFRAETLPVWDVAARYVELARQYDHMWKNTKYVLVAMFNKHTGKTAQFNALNTARTAEAMYAAVPPLRALPAVGQLPYRAPAPAYAPRPE